MEQIREMINDSGFRTFKTSLRGFDRKEVIEYISELEQSIKNSVFNYEKKLSEQSNSLTMTLREKETLFNKVEELQKRLGVLSIDIDEQKSELVAENNSLKLRVQELLEYESKNELLNTEITGLKARCDFCESERDGLMRTINEKEEVILEQCKKNAESERLLKTEMEKLKRDYESMRKIQLLNIQSAKEGLEKALTIIGQI